MHDSSSQLAVQGGTQDQVEVVEYLGQTLYSKKRWSHFIKKVYETDLLVCPKCAGEMGIISFIDQVEVIIHKRNSLASHMSST